MFVTAKDRPTRLTTLRPKTVNLLSKALDDYYAINGVHYAILDANGGNFIEYDTAGVEVNVATKKVRIKATESTESLHNHLEKALLLRVIK